MSEKSFKNDESVCLFCVILWAVLVCAMYIYMFFLQLDSVQIYTSICFFVHRLYFFRSIDLYVQEGSL